MKKYLIIFLLLCGTADAATFDNVVTHDNGWVYTFKFKTSPLAIPSPVIIGERNCDYWRSKDFAKSSSEIQKHAAENFCFFNEHDARIDAQKKADDDEKLRIAMGQSSTEIELRRLKQKVVGP